MNNLRVRSVLDQIPEGSSVVDIGSDHGYLPLALIKHRRCRAIAVEVCPGPWEQTCRSAARAAIDLDVRLGYGLRPVAAGEVCTVVMAGMGGETILEIMDDAGPKRNSFPRWVLQPMTGCELLRMQLLHWRMSIDSEWVVKDGNKFYVGLVVSLRTSRVDGRLMNFYPGLDPSILELLGTSLLLNPDPLITSYFQWRLDKLLHFWRQRPEQQRRYDWKNRQRIDTWKKVILWHSRLGT